GSGYGARRRDTSARRASRSRRRARPWPRSDAAGGRVPPPAAARDRAPRAADAGWRRAGPARPRRPSDGTIAIGRRADHLDGRTTDRAHAARMRIGLLLVVSLRAAHELVGAGILPALVRDLGGERWAGPFFAVYGLAAAAGIVAFGRAADR